MALYVVQARGDDSAALERAVLIKDGFSWGAFVFAPFWLLYHRLWIPLLIWIALEAGFIWLVVPHVDGGVSVGIDLLAHLFAGFEGHRWRQAKGSGRAALVDVVEGRDAGDAELRFFRRLSNGAAAGSEMPSPPSRVAEKTP